METENRICTRCNLSPPEVEFYNYEQYGGLERSQCKKCISEKNLEYYHLAKIKDVQTHINRISKMKKEQRFGAALALYRKKTMTQGNLRVLLKEIEF